MGAGLPETTEQYHRQSGDDPPAARGPSCHQPQGRAGAARRPERKPPEGKPPEGNQPEDKQPESWTPGSYRAVPPAAKRLDSGNYRVVLPTATGPYHREPHNRPPTAAPHATPLSCRVSAGCVPLRYYPLANTTSIPPGTYFLCTSVHLVSAATTAL